MESQMAMMTKRGQRVSGEIERLSPHSLIPSPRRHGATVTIPVPRRRALIHSTSPLRRAHTVQSAQIKWTTLSGHTFPSLRPVWRSRTAMYSERVGDDDDSKDTVPE